MPVPAGGAYCLFLSRFTGRSELWALTNALVGVRGFVGPFS